MTNVNIKNLVHICQKNSLHNIRKPYQQHQSQQLK